MKNGEETRTPSRELATWLGPLVDSIDASVKAHLHEEPFQRDAETVRRTLPLIEAVNRYFGAEVRGWENVPRQGPMLIVGNHSGGAQTMDTAPLLQRWVEERGPESPLYMLGYDLLFAVPFIGPWWRKLGLLRADRALARTALEAGAAAAVFPGGDYEVFRPWSERNRIDFGGRMGFIELAVATGVPVVPMTIHGAHQSTIVLTRGRELAQWMGLERLHIKVFPFIWNIPLGVTPAFVPSLQLPAKVTVQFSKPMAWAHIERRQAKNLRVVRRCYDEITGTMQQTLDALAREHPHPVLTRLSELRPAQVVRHLFSAAQGQVAQGEPAAPSRRDASRHSQGQAIPPSRRHRPLLRPSVPIQTDAPDLGVEPGGPERVNGTRAIQRPPAAGGAHGPVLPR